MGAVPSRYGIPAYNFMIAILGELAARRGLGFRVEGLGLRVEGLGFRVEGLGLRV